MAYFNFNPNKGLVIGWKLPNGECKYISGNSLDNIFGSMMMDCLPDESMNEFFGISGYPGCPFYIILRDTLRQKGIPKLADCKDGHSPFLGFINNVHVDYRKKLSRVKIFSSADFDSPEEMNKALLDS